MLALFCKLIDRKYLTNCIRVQYIIFKKRKHMVFCGPKSLDFNRKLNVKLKNKSPNTLMIRSNNQNYTCKYFLIYSLPSPSHTN